MCAMYNNGWEIRATIYNGQQFTVPITVDPISNYNKEGDITQVYEIILNVRLTFM